MKMAAQVTVTTGRRGGASAVSRGWRWQLSRCAGEEEDSDVIITYRTLKFFLATHTSRLLVEAEEVFRSLLKYKYLCNTVKIL